MRRRWTTAAAALAALVVATTGFAASSALQPPAGNPRALGEAFLGPRMARTEIVLVIGSAVHDYRIDQGRVTAVRPNAIELLERDGTHQTIPIGPATQIVGKGRLGSAPAVAPRMNALTIRDGAQPAQYVYLSLAAAGRALTAKALGESFLGPRMARAEVVLVDRGVVRDYRIDQGRAVAVRSGAIDVLERDGTRQTIPVGPSTQVLFGNQPATIGAVVRGMNVLTIREGDAPAQLVRVTGVRTGGGIPRRP